ncbi:MAG: prepilin-type N-terminal cleavage/methylation domain-containing protein [Chitinophagaceae bacterium]|nr:prepilin-type N-terminal cleavage/methylation domain-containing protein [Rubrivivax sp.]
MRSPQRRRQAGFTIVELIVSMAIVAVLGSIAIAQMRDYSRRAQISELVMAVGVCKNAVTEGYLTLQNAPDPGRWGCEAATAVTKYGGAIQTSTDGAIRITINNLDGLVNGRHVYMVPVLGGGTPMSTNVHLGQPVRQWACGSDWQPVRNALPATCRTDTTAIAAGSDFN